MIDENGALSLDSLANDSQKYYITLYEQFICIYAYIFLILLVVDAVFLLSRRQNTGSDTFGICVWLKSQWCEATICGIMTECL